MVDPEGAEEPGDGLGAHGVQEPEGDPSGGRVGVGAYGVGGPLHLGERPLGGGEEAAARRGEGDRAAPAGEEGHAEVLFEPDHRPRERGLRDAHLGRGAGHVLVPGDGREVREPGREQQPHVFFVTVR